MTTLTFSHDRHAARPPRPAAACGRSRSSRPSDPRDRRFTTTLEIAAVVAIGIALIIATIVASRPHTAPASDTTRVFVERGDSVWSLAEEHPVAGQTTEQTVQQILDLNGLSTPSVPAGTALRLPAQDSQTPLLARR